MNDIGFLFTFLMLFNNPLGNRISIREIKDTFKVGNEMARKLYPALNNDTKIMKGRPPVPILPVELDYVNTYKSDFNVGYQRLYQVSQKKLYAPKTLTEWKVRKIFDYEDLYVNGGGYNETNQHEKRFVAKYANQSWHTDLHYTEKYLEEYFIQYYLICFIDDRSRKILHYELLPTKTMEVTSISLVHALQKYQKPKTIIIDNGKEFIGNDFVEVCQKNGISIHKVSPYTPEENGKIERFWETLERSKPPGRRLREPYLSQIINEYNSFWNHSGLYEITKQRMTQNEAWSQMTFYNGQEDAGYIYY